MSLTTRERDILDNSGPDAQRVELGTEVYDNQVEVAAATADIVEIRVGQSIVLPVTDPGVAGQLWANNLIVTVSAG